ncbi:MAG: hypothetical protein NC186_00660 [Prevotella sp.]|nr:hypothetical protein [Prevotella sp.]
MVNENVISGNLRVEGWLDAPNIRGFLKGLFPSVGALMEAFPRPLPGWAALVGESLPAKVYVAAEGTWRATGGSGPSISVQQPVAPDLSVIESKLNSLLQEETARLTATDESLIGALASVANLRFPSFEWNEDECVSQANKLVAGSQAAGFCRSQWIELLPGETIICVGDTGGLSMPIVLEATDQPDGWWDFPLIGTDLSAGARSYRYTSEKGDRVMVSLKGAPCSLFIYREVACKVCTRLIAVDGSLMSGSRRQSGGCLHADGSTSKATDMGISRHVKVSAFESVEVTTNIDSPDDESHAIAVFYDENGEILQSHYSGTRIEGSITWRESARTSSSRLAEVAQSSGPVLFYHDGGEKHLRLQIPEGSYKACFGYSFPKPRGASNPEFRVELS